MDELRSSLVTLLGGGGAPVSPIAGREIVIYGAGNCGRKVAARARKNHLHVCAFLDANCGLTNCEGIPCFAPDSPEAKDLARAGTAVVLGIFNYAVDTMPIRRSLEEKGFIRILSYPEFYDLYGGSPDYWLTKRADYNGREREILECLDLFGDTASRQIYYDSLAYRLTFNPGLLSNPDCHHHYLPTDFPLTGSPMRLIDCGAFTGDSVILFLENGIQFDSVAAFEPDPKNYKQLCLNLARVRERLGRSFVIPCAVGDDTKIVSFSGGAGPSSAVGGGSMTNIQSVALDDILPDFAPTFIKLDVEGAEPLALKGAARLIERYLPRLAVSAYHCPEHLWTIPKLIRNMEPRYSLALRYHQWNGFDIVVYAFTA